MNKIEVAGRVSKPKFSHETFGERMFEFCIYPKRWSGVEDELICLVPETLAREVKENEKTKLYGEIRSRIDAAGRLVIYVFVTGVSEYEQDMNVANLTGFICKCPVYHETPLGRNITDVMIASNRERNRRNDYIPCIFWGRNSFRTCDLKLGTEMEVFGRLQSRLYLKKYEDGTEETRQTHELSANSFCIVKRESEEKEDESC